jgi:hypothetical protein
MTQRLMARRSKAGGVERKLHAAGCVLPAAILCLGASRKDESVELVGSLS